MLLYSTTDRNWRQPLSHCVMEALAPDKGDCTCLRNTGA